MTHIAQFDIASAPVHLRETVAGARRDHPHKPELAKGRIEFREMVCIHTSVVPLLVLNSIHEIE